jgi:hypothetical protein
LGDDFGDDLGDGVVLLGGYSPEDASTVDTAADLKMDGLS